MVERKSLWSLVPHVVLLLGVVVVAFPVFVTLIASTQTSQQIVQQVPMSLMPGGHMLETYKVALFGGQTTFGGRITPVAPMMMVSLISALTIALGKIAISLLSAFAFVYFRFPGRGLCFWLVFVTLMLPVEVRIYPTYKIASDLNMLDSYAGLTIPLIASARTVVKVERASRAVLRLSPDFTNCTSHTAISSDVRELSARSPNLSLVMATAKSTAASVKPSAGANACSRFGMIKSAAVALRM